MVNKKLPFVPFLLVLTLTSLFADEELALHWIGKHSDTLSMLKSSDWSTSFPSGSVTPLALASSDFNNDGYADVVAGFSKDGRGMLLLLKGNGDTIYPNYPNAVRRKQEGKYTGAPFEKDVDAVEIPEPPNFLVTGDFNGDGFQDIVCAARGSRNLAFIAGEGDHFQDVTTKILPGEISSVAAGEVNRRDGLEDLVVSILIGRTSRILVYEDIHGAWNSPPEIIAEASTVNSLAIGYFDDDAFADIAAGTDNGLLIIHGRDRKLYLPEEERKIAAPEVRQVQWPGSVISLAAGYFTEAPRSIRNELAVLTRKGALIILSGTEKKKIFDSGADIRSIGRARVSTHASDDLLLYGYHGWQVANPGLERGIWQADEADAPVAALALRLNEDGLDDLLELRSSEPYLRALVSVPNAVFAVNSSGDTPDNNIGNGICADASALCTLRAAIQEANSTPAAETINFSTGTGPITITPASPLPSINAPITLDGTTQPGFAGSPIVVIAGSPAAASGLLFGSGGFGSIVRGLVIRNFPGSGILDTTVNMTFETNFIGTDLTGTSDQGNGNNGIAVQSNGTIGGTAPGVGNVISGNSLAGIGGQGFGLSVQGNLIGLNASGSAAIPNMNGIDLGGNLNVIGGQTAASRNIISGNQLAGVRIIGSNQSVQGNFIGTDLSGAVAVPNQSSGALLEGCSGCSVGGNVPQAQNIVSGNGGFGISDSGGTENLISMNRVGTTSDGTAALPNLSGITSSSSDGTIITFNLASGNTGTGILVDHSTNVLIRFNRVGTDQAGLAALPNNNGILLAVSPTIVDSANVISGNTGNGIVGINSVGATIRGNFIGTNISGNAAIPNNNGIFFNASSRNQIGGPSSAARNIISGNAANGIQFIGGSNFNTVEGNFIGINAGGSSLANQGNGIQIDNSSGNNVGGSPTVANRIEFNGANGIVVTGTSSGNTFSSNVIDSNALLGIDLGNNGVTLNDNNDADIGANGFQNFPVLSSVQYGNGTTISGTLNSTANTSFVLEFYQQQSCDGSGNGEGTASLGSATVSTGTSNTANFVLTIPTIVPAGVAVTAIVTGPDGTSEFSACAVSTCADILLLPTFLPDGIVNVAYSQNFEATGGLPPYTFTSSAGLPPGLSLSPSGTLSGTPTTAGSFSFTVTATDSLGCGTSRSYTVVIGCTPMGITPLTLPNGTFGQTYNATLTANGGTPPFLFAASGALPPGITLSSSGTLSGTPTASGVFSFVVTVTDNSGCSVDQTYFILVFTDISALNDSYQMARDTVLNVSAPAGVLSNDDDPEDNNPLTAVLVSNPSNGTLTLSNDGSFTYTPAAGFVGSDSFTYIATDGVNQSQTATVAIDVQFVSSCLFEDDFEGGTIDTSRWTVVKQAWNETGGNLVGAPPKGKALILGTGFAGCTNCSIQTTMRIDGDPSGKVSLLGWYVSKKESVELMMIPKSDRWILKQKSPGQTKIKAKAIAQIDLGVDYSVVLSFDGTSLHVSVDGTEILNVATTIVPFGISGYQVKGSTGLFSTICIQ